MDDQEDSEKRERVLLRPWLENLIESGSIPGLEWMDDGKAMFKVPWKHRSKKTWSLRHSSIFLEWAKNTGRWSEGDPEPNYAQLKTRLRCAFNKAPDIEEMRELHRTKAEEPYKVYKFIPRKESKLYPFGRRPLRKTTIPITVRRRRYFSSRTALTCRRFALSEPSSIRIKEEKAAVSDISYNQRITEEGNLNEAVINQTWKNWVPDQSQRLNGSSRSAWPHFYEHEANDEVNRILPLIVEEVNTNSMDDIESPMNKEVRSRLPSPTLPEISEDQINLSVQSSVGTSFIGLPKFSRDDLMAKEGTRNQEVFSSYSLASGKLEHHHNWHQDSSVLFASGLFVAHPSNNSIITDGANSILPRVNGELDRSDSVIPGSSSGATVRRSPSGTGAKSELLGHSPNHFIPESRPSNLVRDPETTVRHRPSLVPSARLLPLKKLYIASQNAFDTEKSSVVSHSMVHEKHVDAVMKPNVIAQSPVSVNIPYDDISTPESGQQLTAECILGDASKDADLPGLEVMDLSAKISANEMQNSESRVLDLTKKMVVTPFERDRHENMWRNEAKAYFPDMEKDIIDENLVPFDTDATVGELLKFNSEYKRKRQLIVTKMMLLLEKEKELKTREKQMAAREEVLFWKETYLHRVLFGLDYSRAMLNSRSGTFAPSYETSHGSVALMGSPEMKEASPKNLAPSALTLFTPQHSLVVTPRGVSGNNQQQAALSNFPRPDYLGNVSGFQFGSRDAKNNMFSSTATAASSYVNPHHVPVVAAQPVAYEDSKVNTKASMLLSSSDQLKFYRSSDSCFEPEADVALGDAYPVRRSYPLTVRKSQPEAAPLLLTAANETAVKPLQVTRKRGRPKGSKNKVKHVEAVGSMSPQIRQMPPLLGIQSSGINDVSAQNSQPFLPFHSVRNESLSEVVTDYHEDVDSTVTCWDQSCGIDTRACRSQEMNRVLPPLTTDSSLGLMMNSDKVGLALLTSESGTSNPLPVVHSSLLDRLPNKDIMPETVRQLLVSASKPVNAILPPLSPPKSPDGSSLPEPKVNFVHHHERKSSEAENVVTSVC